MPLPSDDVLFRDPNMVRKSIARLQDIVQAAAVSGQANAEQTRLNARLGFAAALKRLINAKDSLENILTEDGFALASQAVYALDWRAIYFAAEERWLLERSQTYWQRLWAALLNRRPYQGAL